MPPKSKKNIDHVSPKSGSPKNKTKRCPKGEVRNPKTGVCEKKGEQPLSTQKKPEKQKPPKQIEPKNPPKNLSKMTVKDQKVFEQRKSCIESYRGKLPSLIEEKSEEQETESAEKISESKSKKTLKQKRCPKGEIRNPKTGVCEKK